MTGLGWFGGDSVRVTVLEMSRGDSVGWFGGDWVRLIELGMSEGDWVRVTMLGMSVVTGLGSLEVTGCGQSRCKWVTGDRFVHLTLRKKLNPGQKRLVLVRSGVSWKCPVVARTFRDNKR